MLFICFGTPASSFADVHRDARTYCTQLCMHQEPCKPVQSELHDQTVIIDYNQWVDVICCQIIQPYLI